MKILAVSRIEHLRNLVEILMIIYPTCIIIPIEDGMSAVQYAYNNHIDILYTYSITLHLHGLDVIHLVKKARPDVVVYYISENLEDIPKAKQKGITGYYITPISQTTFETRNVLAEKNTELFI